MSKNLHLEHIEDLMLMFGTDGIKESFDYIDDLVRTFSANPSGNRNISTKWDGAPAIFCGPDPYDGRFFVAKKGIFNKKPKLYKSITEIDEDKLAEGLKTTFKSVFTYMKPIYDSGKLKDVVQGDFLFESGGRTLKRVHGEDCVLFKPQLIVYCIPKHDELYEKAKRCKLCVVIHAKYPAAGAKHVSDLSVNFGFDASQHSTEDCLIISPFTSELGKSMIITPAEKRKLIEYKRASMRLSSQCGSFLNTIASDYDNKWGVSYLLKQYFNARVREGQKVNSASVFYRDFINYFETKFRDEIAKKAQEKTKAMWKKKMYDGLDVLENSKTEFVAMVGLYNTIQNVKSIFIPKFESGERFKTFYYNEKDGSYDIGDQEGYVVVKESTRAVKIVQRLGGFSERNFNEMKKWAK